jgi:selenocysteine lyase/cysteine desulfurase
VICLDNAATSFPQPPAAGESIVDFLERSAGNLARSGHALAIATQTVVAATRSQLAARFGEPDPARIAFALNWTDALKLARWGLGQHHPSRDLETTPDAGASDRRQG